MPAHTCACHYGPDGLCIWCHNGIPDKVPHAIPGVEDLSPPITYGKPAGNGSNYRPISAWGRAQVKRSAMECLPGDLLGLWSEDEIDVLAQMALARRSPDRIVGSGLKLEGARPVIRAGHLK